MEIIRNGELNYYIVHMYGWSGCLIIPQNIHRSMTFNSDQKLLLLHSILPSVQVQTDDRRPKTAGRVTMGRGQAGSAAQMLQNNKPKKTVDAQFESTTKLVLLY